MIISSAQSSSIRSSGMASWRFKDSKIPTIPLSYTAVVTSLKRVFAWVCG